MAHTTINIEGGMFPADLLDRIASGDARGQRAEDFGLTRSSRLSDETQSAFSDIRSFWDAFQRRIAYSRESPTTLTREAWMIPALERLGFTLEFQRAGAQVGGENYVFSHRAGDDSEAPPVHIVALDQKLDRKTERERRSPHTVVQEYLNRSDALWGIVTNGEQLRLLRDSNRLAKPTYLEFDLRGMVEGNLYSEFALLYRLLHRSRLPRGAADAHECWLEKYYNDGIEQGGRVREHLREGVEEAIEILGTSLLGHPDSEDLRAILRDGRLSTLDYYRQLLRLIYRFLFLFVAEERRLITTSESGDADKQAIYNRYYSLARLRDLCERHIGDDPYSDLWEGLLRTFQLFRTDKDARQLGLSALDSELFGSIACRDLEGASCHNVPLLQALFHLSTFKDDHVRRRVNYAALDVEEFGSVYEGLLEYHPQVIWEGKLRFVLAPGSERKQTGSYYTPPELVHELIESALMPVIEDRLANAHTPEQRERALLSMKVCDPASGSGHFMLAAARRIGRELARARSGEDEPPPEAFRVALRDVIRHCIYAVDKNPLAVDLCKVALWIEGHSAGMPLSFLDHHIKCGDSLIGVLNLDVLLQGIPDDAYKRSDDDEKEASTYFRKRNKAERGGQTGLRAFEGLPSIEIDEIAAKFAALANRTENTPRDVHESARLYDDLHRPGSDWHRFKIACDMWTATFFEKLEVPSHGTAEPVPTTDIVRQWLAGRSNQYQLVAGKAEGLSASERFFHWPLEFPDVFAQGGFDVVLGNPPWDQIQLDPREFFTSRNPTIADAQPASAREAAIERLEDTNPLLYREYLAALHGMESSQEFIHSSGRFPLSSFGRLNSAPLFAELCRSLICGIGRAGVIVPTGIATDSFNQYFFKALMSDGSLISLHSFENEAFIFPAVHHSTKFCLLTLAGPQSQTSTSDFVFFARHVEDLRDENRHFVLTSEDIALLNPNTHTCPVFRSKRDAELSKSIYGRIPVLLNESLGAEGDPWTFQGMLMFMMNTASHLFRSGAELETSGWQINGNAYRLGADVCLPLFEAKMMHQFDHRFGTYLGQSSAQANQGKLPEFTAEQHNDPVLVPMPHYWIDGLEVEARLSGKWTRNWMLGWRDITSAVTTRTVIASVLPKVGAGNSAPIMLVADSHAHLLPMVAANLNAFVLDYSARFKVGGTHLNFYIFQQLALLPPSGYSRSVLWSRNEVLSYWLLPRVLELTYTAWDLEPFAKDCGYDGPPFRWDEERRFMLRCELDAAYFHLYGIARDDVDYIMETFPIVKRHDLEKNGEYRTKRVILEIYDEMTAAIQSGVPYQTRLDPPPADPRVAHPPREAAPQIEKVVVSGQRQDGDE